MLELTARGGEQFLANSNVIVHRTADIETKQNFDGVVPLRNHADVQKTGIARSLVDRIFQVELICRAFARELAQSTQCYLDIARAKLHRIVQVFVLAAIPYLYSPAVA